MTHDRGYDYDYDDDDDIDRCWGQLLPTRSRRKKKRGRQEEDRR